MWLAATYYLCTSLLLSAVLYGICPSEVCYLQQLECNVLCRLQEPTMVSSNCTMIQLFLSQTDLAICNLCSTQHLEILKHVNGIMCLASSQCCGYNNKYKSAGNKKNVLPKAAIFHLQFSPTLEQNGDWNLFAGGKTPSLHVSNYGCRLHLELHWKCSRCGSEG